MLGRHGSSDSRRFKIALSFPGEHRRFVKIVASRLAEVLGKDRVFYDEWYETELVGLDGDLKLRRYYREQSEMVVPFFSEHYEKDWCQIEWSAVRAMLKARRSEDAVIPVQLDGTRVEGWEDIDFAIRKKARAAKCIADLIIAAYRLRFPTSATPRVAKTWSPAVLYPLQPAPHFAGRKHVLAELTRWARDPSDANRVVALIAAGGTGKTAIAERVLGSLAGYDAAGVFVWSFYENPQTEAFLAAAYEYFVGEPPPTIGGVLDGLQHGLRADQSPHLLILDGLELIQADGNTGRPRGELERDPLLKRLLRWLAAGLGVQAKALITSRFPLPDLEDWTGHGFQPYQLDDLDADAARSVLRRRGVNGDDAALDELSRSVHRHALTVDVLGLYLSRFGDGDPKKAPQFTLAAVKSNQKGRRLTTILTNYAARLPNDERDLLARMALFRRGLTIDYLVIIAQSGPDVAGTLSGYEQGRLIEMLEALRDLGLVFRSEGMAKRNYSVHPFLGEFFRSLLGATKPEMVHEMVRRNLAPNLEGSPEHKPTNPLILDQYEQLIEFTRLAGDINSAIDLFFQSLGHYQHLGRFLGDYARGLRILSYFSEDGTPATIQGGRFPWDLRGALATLWGMFATHLGDLNMARRAFDCHNEYCAKVNGKPCDFGLSHSINVEVYAGRWPAALSIAFALADSDSPSSVNANHGVAYAALGRLEDARRAFLAPHPERGIHETLDFPGTRVWGIEFKLATGDRIGARKEARAVIQRARARDFKDEVALCETLLGFSFLSKKGIQAREHLVTARKYADRTGSIEVALRCYHLAAAIARGQGNFNDALAEALDGIQLADSCGFGRWSLDIRTELARIHLAAGCPIDAVEPAEWVLTRSQEPDCEYAWGVADALHLLGVAHARLGGNAKARGYLNRAMKERKLLKHPGLTETAKELRRLT